LLGVGTTIWIGGRLAFSGALLLIIGGEWRARREESALLAAFGERYREYASQVRRVLPLLY
jgi:protein-S-isoprenylcysteine O-methyltransferase Ste14